MSSENWRESKREEEDENDWRRAPTRERWGDYAVYFNLILTCIYSYCLKYFIVKLDNFVTSFQVHVTGENLARDLMALRGKVDMMTVVTVLLMTVIGSREHTQSDHGKMVVRDGFVFASLLYVC